MIALPLQKPRRGLGGFLPACVELGSRESNEFGIGAPRLPVGGCGKQLQLLESVSHLSGICRPIGDALRPQGAELSYGPPGSYGCEKELATWHRACNLSLESVG